MGPLRGLPSRAMPWDPGSPRRNAPRCATRPKQNKCTRPTTKHRSNSRARLTHGQAASLGMCPAGRAWHEATQPVSPCGRSTSTPQVGDGCTSCCARLNVIGWTLSRCLGTRWASTGTFSVLGWTVLFCQATQGVDGVLVAIKAPNGWVRARSLIPGRLLEVDWRRCQVPMVLYACYAPGDQRSAEERRRFWSTLGAGIPHVSARRPLVVAGSFQHPTPPHDLPV